MITNRTQADVDAAKEILLRAQQAIPFPLLSDDEVAVLERGTCTITMLNRVEGKQSEIAQLLTDFLYMVHIFNKTDWTYNNIFTYQDHERLLSNLNKLKQAFFVYSNTPNTPDYLYNYENANSVEKICVDIKAMIENMRASFRRCNTFSCGQRRKT